MVYSESGRIKLIFITTKNNEQTDRFQELVVECIKVLAGRVEAKFQGSDVHFNDPTQIGNDSDFCRFDCYATVNDKPLWKIFSPLSQFLVHEMKQFAEHNSSDDLQFRTSLQIQDRAFFDIGQLNGADLQVKAQSVYFGNLIKHDSFITHYIIDDDPNNGWYGDAEVMRYYFGEEKERNVDKNHTIYIDFEHDRHRLVIVFPMLWPDNSRDDMDSRGSKKNRCVAKLVIGYGSIRRLFCDFDKANDNKNALSLYLHLKSPPLISVVKFNRRNEKGSVVEQNRSDLRTILGDRYMHWIPHKRFEEMREPIRAVAESSYVRINFTKDNMERCVHILGRLYAASQKMIEVRQIVFYRENAFTHQYLDSPLDNRTLRELLWYNNDEDFPAVYLIVALLSRGSHVKDQLLVEEEHREKFIKVLTRLALDSLERLLNASDERFDMRPLYEMFEESILKCRAAAEAEGDQKLMDKKGYIRLRKVTITPTRMIFEAPELIMGNRVLRADQKNFPAQRFLRIAFRDDDWSRIQANIGAKFIEKYVKHALYNGINVADRFPYNPRDKYKRVFNYLGSSNSQMREQGCYFIEANDKEIQRFRESLGAFEKKSVPKLMARFGQCFTQSHVMEKSLKRERYNYVIEYTGGSDSQGKEYTFSDGVGCMSRAFASEIAKELKLGDFIPSCIQSRFRGFKGVHAVNPNMDLLTQWARKHGFNDTHKNKTRRYYYIDLMFRNSQLKFKASQDNQFYEVVKLSGPSPVALNRPMINILDQVSAMQSYSCHKRVTDRIFQLLDRQLQLIARTMIDETLARHRLGEFPRVIMFEALQNVNLTQEPFFKAMLRTAGRCQLKKLRTKLQIAIPDDMGRSMLGVIDETGLLNYGQVYIRYTVNMQQKRPGRVAARKTITGPVLLTKNPMIVAGDVRMFEAVDIPALSHLCDVVVFPRNGPRPHPDEMAGSDLDGDEYSVIWDAGLYLLKSEPAFDYTPDKTTPIAVNEDELRKQMADFFVKYISHDSIGKLATAFLVNSDIYGIESDVCEVVARKHMEAVDFPKTGEPPQRLARSDPTKDKPSEDPPRKPDYMEQFFKPTYLSPRLNGRLFRRIKSIDDVLEVSIDDQLNQPPKKDPHFYIDGVDNREFEEFARNSFSSYKASMENLLQRFGINSEVEIFSNSYSVMRKRISDKEEDDFSFFNTQRIIEEEIESIYSTHRRRLVEHIYGEHFMSFMEWPYKMSKSNEREARIILRSVVRDPSNDLKRLALAYYNIAYGQEDQRFLSFAWLGADILFKVRQNRINKLNHQSQLNPDVNQTTPSMLLNFDFDPLSSRISQHIAEFIQAREKSFGRFRAKIFIKWQNHTASQTVGLLRAYCERHKGLLELLFFTHQWAKERDILIDEPKRDAAELERIHLEEDFPAYNRLTICLTFIQFGLHHFERVSIRSKRLKSPMKIMVETLVDTKLVNEVDLTHQHGGLGKKFLLFLEFLSTLEFAQMQRQSFSRFQLNTTFAKGQHIKLHKIAETSFYRLAFTDDFTVLPYSKTYQTCGNSLISADELDRARPAVDGESFVFELPIAAHSFLLNQDRLKAICSRIGLNDIFIRQLPNKESDLTIQSVVTVAGTLQSVNLLRHMFAPSGYINCKLTETMLAQALSSQVLYRLIDIKPPTSDEKRLLSRRKRSRRPN